MNNNYLKPLVSFAVLLVLAIGVVYVPDVFQRRERRQNLAALVSKFAQSGSSSERSSLAGEILSLRPQVRVNDKLTLESSTTLGSQTNPAGVFALTKEQCGLLAGKISVILAFTEGSQNAGPSQLTSILNDFTGGDCQRFYHFE